MFISLMTGKEPESLSHKMPLKSAASDKLIHCGVRLKGNESLQDAGITSGAVIHCLPKKGNQTTPVPVPVGISEVQQLLLSLRTLVGNAQFRPLIQKLKTPEMVEKVMAACPEVQRDPMALALMQDPELVLGLVNPDHLSEVVEEHPAVAQVIHHVCGLLSSHGSSQRSHHVSYSMDALSDDEQMEEGGEWQAGSASGSNSSLPPITPAQLAAALASAAGNGSSTSSSSRTSRNSGTSLASTSAPPAPSASDEGPITAQMFSQALQNALAASSRTASSTPFMGTSQASGGSGATAASIPNLDESLQLMREMGIPDEELSKQALQATNGDVQAAVNLIFAQWMADDDNM
ncbi:ubiquitin-like protein 7 [Oratosquilla oratoria]|uniref:ubiquitin-like protein 7 n=1 Tax=Oratosquilla oratoria TaxID=337810 RepID=UPI003F760DDF